MSTLHPHRDTITTLVFAAAWSDGSVCHNEKAALERILSHLLYSADEIAARLAASDDPSPDLDSIEVPQDLAVRLEILRYAMAVTMADGSLQKSEFEFLKKLTRHMGVSIQALTILRTEAENLAAAQGQGDAPSIIARVEALLPEAK